MQNNVAEHSIRELLNSGNKSVITATAIGQEMVPLRNTGIKIDADYSTANTCFLTLQEEIANRVPLASSLADSIGTTRTWCFRAKDTLKPFLGESHNTLYRPTGFVSSLRVPEDFDDLFALVGNLQKYFADHPEQTNPSSKVNVTAARADAIYKSLEKARLDLDAQDELIADKQIKQDEALEFLRDRLRGVIGELKQVLPEDDRRWKRFGFNIPAEPETPASPEQVEVNNTVPGRLLVTCAPVPFADHYRCFAAKAGTTEEPVAVGSSNEPLFFIEGLEESARYNVFVSAVNSSGNEGPRSNMVAAQVQTKAA